MLRTCLFISVLFALSASYANAGNWPTSRGDNERSGVVADDVNVASWNETWIWQSPHRPQVAWSGPAKWDAYANILNLPNMRDYDRCFGVIAVGDRVWFASSTDDSVYSVSAKTGEVLWTHIATGPIRMAPTFDKGRVYFGDDSGTVTCLHADTGKTIWKHESPTTRTDIIHNGRFISPLPCRTGVLVRDNVAWFAYGMLPWQNAFLCAVDASTGKIESDNHFEKRHAGATFEGPLAIAGNLLIACQGRVPPRLYELSTGKDRGSLATGAGGAGGSFLSVTAAGDILHGPGNKATRIVRTRAGTAKPIASYANSRRAVATNAGTVLASEAGLQLINNTGKSVWKRSTAPLAEIAVAGETVIAGGENEVLAFQLADGTPIWRRPVTGNACDIAICGERLIVSTDAGAIHCFAPSGKKNPEPTGTATAPPTDASDRPQPASAEPTRGLMSQWVFEVGMEDRARRRGLENPERFVGDQQHNNDARMTGPLQLREAGAAQAIVLDGKASVLISKDVASMKLPTEAMTVAAWVRVDQPTAWGGFIGFLQDNGSFERGWVLGFKDDHFSFALKSKAGNGALTYLTAKNPYANKRWHHVVGVYDGKIQRIYVDGKLAGEAKTQQGKIDYPESGFFEIGAYHDDNEHYPLNGQIHAITLYDQALTANEVATSYRAKENWFPQPTRLAVGPWWRFEPAGTATVGWRTAEPSPSLIKTTLGRVIPDDALATPKTEHLVRLGDLPANAVGMLRIETRGPAGVGETPDFDFDTHFDRSVPQVSLAASDDESVIANVASFRRQTEINRGIALFIGAGQASIAEELIRQTEFRVLLLVSDSAELAAVQTRWHKLGIYGIRASARLLSSNTLGKLPKGCFNLVAADSAHIPEMITTDALTTFAISGRGWTATPTIDRSDEWRLTQRPQAKGTGSWTHQYGSAGNSAFGGESLAGVSRADDLEVRWIGRPGPRMQPDRSGRKPSPLAGGGRLYVQGMHRMAAVDAANGTLLWGLEIPAFERFNIPRDSGNWCCDEDHVYAAIGGHTWKIDGETGEIKSMLPLVCSDSSVAPYDWSYIARAQDGNQKPHLLGSSVKQGTAYTNFWGNAAAGWYDARSGPATYKICSENLFSLDPDSGKQNWEYQGGLIINPTITVDARHLYFVEARYPSLKSEATRRFGNDDFWKEQYLVSLNLASGKVEWEKPLVVERGGVVFYLAAADGKLVITTSNDKKYAVYGFDTKTGKETWRQSFGWPGGAGDHGKAMSRPAIVGGKVYVRPRAMDLATGELLKQTVPLGGCGTYAATENALIFRQSAISMWSPEANAVTKWSRLRPGCWLSTVPACGMVLSPEAGGGCSCGQWLEASIGFAPK